MSNRRIGRSLAMLIAATLTTAACGIGNNNTVTTPLPDVDAVDDEVVTFMNTPVTILVLNNDEQDDDLLTDLGIAVDQDMNEQPGAAEIDPFSFPERVIYTPPTDFLGTVTFTYDITGLGAQFDFSSTDTATVTVTVTDVRPPVMANADMRTIDEDDEPVRIFVLQNDFQDADEIDMFDMDALDDMGNLQLGAVTLETFPNVHLIYTPPPDFDGTVTFSYIILGAGVRFFLNSVASATVTVEVVAPPDVAIVQFEDASMQQFEIMSIFVGADAIFEGIPTAMLFEPGVIPY